ncbi:MAG: NHL repeat-containing protein, partial [Deltaproteobacteria bacterium]|nr:NHL repeat-containing protein [Deltaproteobacteria bacterium]
SGDGTTNPDGTNATWLDQPVDIAIDATGRVFVTGYSSQNVFRIDPNSTITEILDESGDGTNSLDGPWGLAFDEATGQLFVSGYDSDNIFRVEPDGTVTEILDAAGAGPSQPLDGPREISVDNAGDLVITGSISHNVISLQTSGALVAVEILNITGDGTNDLFTPWGIATDATGDIYVTGLNSYNAFRFASVSAAPALDPSAIALLAGALATAGSAILRKARDY